MKSLKYTNFLLTVIAICLVYQCVKFGAPPSAAQAGYKPAVSRATPVQIVGTPTVKIEGRVDTTISNMPRVDVYRMSAISGNQVVMPVTMTTSYGRAMDVNIVGTRQDLPVRVSNFPR